MATVYVTEPGVQVHKQGERLLLKRGSETLQDIPMLDVERVVLMGKGVAITTPTLYDLTRRKIEVLYLNSRGGYVSRVIGREHGHSRLRQAQAIRTTDPASAFTIAHSIVNGKINNQRVLVQRHAEGASWSSNALVSMSRIRGMLDSATNLDELRGHEGIAAKEYFGLLRRLFKSPADGPSWNFNRREYYPPPDPINALLSFGYTLLLNDLIAACQLAGLDPDLGFFHAIDYNKPSMALDLEEEFRPIIVDSIVLAGINRGMLRLNDFEIGGTRRRPDNHSDQDNPSDRSAVRPVYLKDEPRKKFISLYEARVNEQIFYPPTGESRSYRQIFQLQAYQMGKMILGGMAHYTPFTVR